MSDPTDVYVAIALDRITDLCKADARIASLERSLLSAESALSEAKADAERYRWLRENFHVNLLCGFFGNGCVNRRIEEVDAAIDAALVSKGDMPTTHIHGNKS